MNVVSANRFDRAWHRTHQAFELAAQHGDQAGVPVLPAIGILEPVLALPADPALRIASKSDPNLVHALVEPLHARVLAGLATMDRGIFGRSASRKPERDGSGQAEKDEQGNTHSPSVGLHAGWLKSAAARIFIRRVAKIDPAIRHGGWAISQEGER